MQQHPGRSDRFDVVVVGAGSAGLSAAAFLADAGQRVLVVDANSRPGGLLAVLPLPGFHISAGVHNVTEAFTGGPAGEGMLAAAARHLRLDGVQWLPLDPTYEVRYPEARYRVPVGRDAWIEAFARQLPGQESALSDLLDLCEKVAVQFGRLPIVPDPASLARMPREAPLVLRYLTANTLDVLQGRLGDRRLARAVSSLCEGLPRPAARTSVVRGLGHHDHQLHHRHLPLPGRAANPRRRLRRRHRTPRRNPRAGQCGHLDPVPRQTRVRRLRSGLAGVARPHLCRPTQAPPGQHLVELVCAVDDEAEDPFTQATDMIDCAHQIHPELADRMVPLDPNAPTPYAIRRFSAPYGWACTPIGASLGRLAHTSPLKGMYLAGRWTLPGHGIPQVVASGAEASRIITNDRTHQPLQPLS